MVRVEPGAYLFGAVLLLTLPLRWLTASFAAAAFHELCHVGMGYLVGGNVHYLRIASTGAKLDMTFPSPLGELLCALAGPVGSLALMCCCRSMPRLALCGLVQGIFNLLPVYPLDGGRILRCVGSVLRERIDKVLAK